MANEKDDPKSLEMRLTRLENAIAQLTASRKAADVSAEEMKTYLKVRDSIEPDFCGPNDCMTLCIARCLRCLRCFRCITRCIFECNCGPCGFGGGPIETGFSDIGR
jgi:hypothetical protein